MAATYSGDPGSSDRDWVRFVIQDTDASNADLQDAEIDAAITEKSDKVEAAVFCQQAICAKFVTVAMRANEPGSVIDEIKGWCKERIESIRTLSSTTDLKLITPYAPWRSFADKTATLDDSDRIPARFSRGQHSFTEEVTTLDDDVTT
jgi:hypothetical protein